MKFDLGLMKRRIQQPTTELMEELGGIVECPVRYKGVKHKVLRRYAWKQTGAKVLAVAHCDCVDGGSKHFQFDQETGLVFSSRLDDRLGVHTIVDILPKIGIPVDVLLTDFEECGASTGLDFALDVGQGHKYNWMFQFDRRGDDAVCYDYWKMQRRIRSHFTLGQGSFSDICAMDTLGISGLNIGVGYHQEHTLGSYAILDETAAQIVRFAKFYGEFHDELINNPAKKEVVVKKNSSPTVLPGGLGEGARGTTRHDKGYATDAEIAELRSKLSSEARKYVDGTPEDLETIDYDLLTEKEWQMIIDLDHMEHDRCMRSAADDLWLPELTEDEQARIDWINRDTELDYSQLT